jgi:hypothetical protein
LRRYDLKNWASMTFWRTHDFSDRQLERALFGVGAESYEGDDDLSDEEAVAIALGERSCFVDRGGEVVMVKAEPVELAPKDLRRAYRRRVLAGELPL